MTFRANGRRLASVLVVGAAVAGAAFATAISVATASGGHRRSHGRNFGQAGNGGHDTYIESGAVVVRSDAEIQRERSEEVARKAAVLHWLDEGFSYAKRVGAKGIPLRRPPRARAGVCRRRR